MNPVIPGLAGALVAGGALLVGVGLTRRPPAPPRPPRSRTRKPQLSRRTRLLLGIGGAVGVLVAVVTGFLAAVVLVPAMVAGLPVLLSAPPAQAQVKRLEAMEEWVRSVAGVLTAGVGLEQALITSLRSTPEPIRPEVSLLVGRLRSRWDTQAALTMFADDLDDATGDLIVAQLRLGARRRGSGLAAVLDALAESVGHEVRARREIEADRAKPRANARFITIFSASFLGVLALSGDYVAPYGSDLGQVLLVALLTLYAAVLVWLRRMTRGRRLPRFIGTAAREAAS